MRICRGFDCVLNGTLPSDGYSARSTLDENLIPLAQGGASAQGGSAEAEHGAILEGTLASKMPVGHAGGGSEGISAATRMPAGKLRAPTSDEGSARLPRLARPVVAMGRHPALVPA